MRTRTPGSLLVLFGLVLALLAMGYGALFSMLDDIRDEYGIAETALGGVIAIGFFAGFLAQVLLAPIAATIIQLAISRQREYSADATGAEICGNPESLASALLRLEAGAQAIPMQTAQATEPLYIVKPFSGGGLASLFSTHPPIEERVRRLRQMRPTIG